MGKSLGSKKYRLEPPEGGWGYIICLGMALSFISASGGLHCFGLIFNDFLKNLGEGTSSVTFITSAAFTSMSFAGLFAHTLFKRFSIRAVGLAGSLLLFLGNLIQVFAQSIIHLFIAHSVTGVAFGFIVPSIFTVFNHYFVKRRVMMMSVTQCVIGIGAMMYPMVVQKLLDKYGFRGCLLIMTALGSHSIFGMVVLHPVEWHMRKVEIEKEEKEEMENVDGVEEHIEKSTDEIHLKPLMFQKGSQILHRKSVDHLKLEESQGLSRRASSIASLSNWTGGVVITEALEIGEKPGKWKQVVDFLDLPLLKLPVYVNIVIGMSFSFYADIAFFTLQPLYLFELGLTKAQTAQVISVGAAADLVSRIFLAMSAACLTIPSRYVYLAGAFFTILARCAFLSVFDFKGILIMTAILGFLKTWLHVPLPLVFAEYLSKERFPSGYGLFMFLQGNIMFLLGPIIGYIRDATNSYAISFQVMNLFLAVCVVPWLIEIIYVKCKGKKEAEKPSASNGNA